MLRKASAAVPKSNGPVPQQEEFGSDESKLVDVYRIFKERFDRRDRKLKKLSDEMRVMSQRVSSLEQDARQPRLAMEADGQAKTNTRERTEGAATAGQAKHGYNSCSTDRVALDPMCSTSFGDDYTGPPAPPCSGKNTLVDNGAAAPKSSLPSLKMRSPSAAGGLVPTSETSTATKITLKQPPLWLYLTEETNLRTLTPCVSCNSSFFQKINLPSAPCCRKVIETKTGENGMLILAVQGRLHACPFWGSWRALLCGEVHVRAG